jgi:hypothetical protein
VNVADMDGVRRRLEKKEFFDWTFLFSVSSFFVFCARLFPFEPMICSFLLYLFSYDIDGN